MRWLLQAAASKKKDREAPQGAQGGILYCGKLRSRQAIAINFSCAQAGGTWRLVVSSLALDVQNITQPSSGISLKRLAKVQAGWPHQFGAPSSMAGASALDRPAKPQDRTHLRTLSFTTIAIAASPDGFFGIGCVCERVRGCKRACFGPIFLPPSLGVASQSVSQSERS